MTTKIAHFYCKTCVRKTPRSMGSNWREYQRLEVSMLSDGDILVHCLRCKKDILVISETTKRQLVKQYVAEYNPSHVTKPEPLEIER